MAQVSIGQVENLEDLIRGLQSLHETLEASCRAQLALALHLSDAARDEALNSEGLLDGARQQEAEAQQAVDHAQQELIGSEARLDSAHSALSSCQAQPLADDGSAADCYGEYTFVAEAVTMVELARGRLAQASAALRSAKEYRQAMEQRVELARHAHALAEQARAQVEMECNARLAVVGQAIAAGIARLNAAQQALSAYLATNPPAAQFHAWLKWDPRQHGGPVTPDTLRDRMNLSSGQRRMLQQYLYERDPAYRKMVERYRGQWLAARGDAERNMVARKVRIHLSGEFGEQMARHALAPLGARIETQGRTFVGDSGRYTKTDLIVRDLRVPVILGRGDGMGAPVGGSMAFEVKCGKAEYLYAQQEHMLFQADGHKQADAQCTLCSRDIHDLSPEKEAQLRAALREAGSPLVGMLPKKNEIDQSCLDLVRHHEEDGA